MYAIVTGGNTGLGLSTAAELCKKGFHVTISVRTDDKGEQAIASIMNGYPSASVDYLLMDLGDLSTVRSFASNYLSRNNKLDLLVNNAGIMNTPFRKTVDGFEEQFQVNHLSHFLLTHLLFPALRLADSARVVNLASRAHLRWNQALDFDDIVSATAATYDGWKSYGRSKTCNILFARALASHFPLDADGKGITFNSLHPGLVNTGLLVAANLSQSTIAGAISIEEGIETTLFLATSEGVRGVSGEYFASCKVVRGSEVSQWAQSAEEAERLFEASLQMCGIAAEKYGI